MAILTLKIENRSAFEHLKSVPNAVTVEAMREAESGQDAGRIMTDSLQSFVDSIIQ